MVKVSLVEGNEWRIRAFAAKLTRKKESVKEIWEEVENLPIEKCKEYVKKVSLKEYLEDGIIKQGYGHAIVREFGNRIIIIDELPRIIALYLWRFINAPSGMYEKGLERSLRIQKPPFKCVDQISQKLYEEALPTYDKFIEKGIPAEDARVVLNEGILTTVVFDASAGTERYLNKLYNAMNWQLSEVKELKNQLEKILKKLQGFVSKDEKPFSDWKLFGEKFDEKEEINLSKNPFSISLNLYVEASLLTHAQLVRERQGINEIEPANLIVKRKRFVIPPSFEKSDVERYKEIAKIALEKQIESLKRNDPSFVYYLLLGQMARSIFHIHGISSYETAKKRSCGAAQWEIRKKIGLKIAEKLNYGPLCVIEKCCIEPSFVKEKCLVGKEWQKLDGENILKKLGDYEIKEFEIDLYT